MDHYLCMKGVNGPPGAAGQHACPTERQKNRPTRWMNICSGLVADSGLPSKLAEKLFGADVLKETVRLKETACGPCASCGTHLKKRLKGFPPKLPEGDVREWPKAGQLAGVNQRLSQAEGGG